jgi:hypothetical protein
MCAVHRGWLYDSSESNYVRGQLSAAHLVIRRAKEVESMLEMRWRDKHDCSRVRVQRGELRGHGRRHVRQKGGLLRVQIMDRPGERSEGIYRRQWHALSCAPVMHRAAPPCRSVPHGRDGRCQADADARLLDSRMSCNGSGSGTVYGGSFQPLSESDRSGRRWEGRAHWGKQCGVARALLQCFSVHTRNEGHLFISCKTPTYTAAIPRKSPSTPSVPPYCCWRNTLAYAGTTT